MTYIEAIRLDSIDFDSEHINSLKIKYISSFHVINKTLHLEF